MVVLAFDNYVKETKRQCRTQGERLLESRVSPITILDNWYFAGTEK